MSSAGTEPPDPAEQAEPDPAAPVDPAPVDPTPARAARRRVRSSTRNAVEWVAVVVGAVVVALVVKTFLLQAFTIPSESMVPTLLQGDRVLVNKLSYDLHDVHRGDVVVFERPQNFPGASGDPQDLIKRVIGLPGETVTAQDGKVFVDGEPLDEPYLADGATTVTLDDRYSLETGITVPDGEVLVMGDNRNNSLDGRKFGPIPEDSIVGHAFARMWPLDRLGTL